MSIRKDNIIAAVDIWNQIYNELTRTDISGYDFETNSVISDSYQGWFTRLGDSFKELSTSIMLVGTNPSCLPNYTDYGQSITPTVLSTVFNNLRNIQQGLNMTLEIAAKGRVSGNNNLTQNEIDNSKQNPPPPARIGAVHKQQVAAYNFKNTLKSAYGLLSNIRNLILVSTKSEVTADINIVYDSHAAIRAEHGYLGSIAVPNVSQGEHQKFDHVRRWGFLRDKSDKVDIGIFNVDNDPDPNKRLHGPIAGFITFYGPYAKINVEKLPPEISAEILNGVYPIYADKIQTKITGDRTGDGYGFLTLNKSDEYWKCIPATNDLNDTLGLERPTPRPSNKNFSLSYFANRMIYVKTGNAVPDTLSNYKLLKDLPKRKYPIDSSHPTPGWTTKNNGHQTGSATYYNVRCFIEKDSSTNPPTYYLYTKHLMTMFTDTAKHWGDSDEDRITADIYYRGGFTIKLGEGESSNVEISDLIQLSSTILGFDTNVLQFGKNIEANNAAASSYLASKGELSTAFINYNVPRDYKADKLMRFSRKNATDIDRLNNLNTYSKFFDNKDNESQYSSIFNQETTGGIVNNYNQISGFPITSFEFTRNTNVVRIPTQAEMTASQNTATVKDKLNNYFTSSTNKNDGKIWSVDSNNISSQTKKQLIKASTVNSLLNDLHQIGKEITKNLYTIYAINASISKKIFLNDFSIWRNNKYVYFPTTLYFKSASYSMASSMITNSTGEFYDDLSSTYPGSVEDAKEQYFYVNGLIKPFLAEDNANNMLDQDFYIGLVNNGWSNSVSATYRNVSSSPGSGSYTRMVINKNVNPSSTYILTPSDSKWTYVGDITTKLTSYNTYPKGMVFEKRAPIFTVDSISTDYDVGNPKIESVIHLSDKGDKRVHSLDSFIGSQTQNNSYDISTLTNGLDTNNLYPDITYEISSDISNFILDISNDIVDQIESGTQITDILSVDVPCNIYLCSPNNTIAGFTVGNYYGNRNSVYPWMGDQISGTPGSLDPNLYENWPGFMSNDGPRDPNNSILTVSLDVSRISDYLISISSEISTLFNT